MRTTVVAVALLLAGCSSAQEPAPDTREQGFNEAIRGGSSCAELFKIRNESDPDYVEAMNERLREIGCHSSSSTRTD